MKRLIALLGAAVAAYLLFQQFVFPGYIAAPVPFHNDMYWAITFVAKGWTFPFFLHWPRPVFFETLLFAGHFGLEGSLAFLTAIVLCDLAIVLALLERFVLKRSIPWWLALGTMLLAMAGPGFYAQPGFDVGYHLALLFGLLGIFAWESLWKKSAAAAWALTAVCFCLSTLANEGFAPALLLYGVFCAVRYRRAPALAVAALSLPLIALAASFADGQLTHSPFVAMHAAKDYPYRIDFSPHSLLHCAEFYLAGIANPAFLLLLLACLPGLWYNRRLPIGAGFLVCGFALYTPYLLLPNHLDNIYQWPPMPLLMLLIPLAWTPSPVTNRPRALANAALVFVLGAAIAFQTTQYRDVKNVYRMALAQNRNIVAAVRAHAPLISASHSILVRGLTFVTDPWAQNGQSVSDIVPFNGTWGAETEIGYPPANDQPNVTPVPADEINYKRYDLVLDFDPAGRIVRAFRPKGYKNVPLEAQSAFYPEGILPPPSADAAQHDGVYPAPDASQCCFLASAASLKLDVPPNATMATFDFYIPDLPPFAHAPERVSASFDGKAWSRGTELQEGAQHMTLALPVKKHRGAVTALLRMSIAFVPKELGINQDVRKLSIMLLRVRYR